MSNIIDFTVRKQPDRPNEPVGQFDYQGFSASILLCGILPPNIKKLALGLYHPNRQPTALLWHYQNKEVQGEDDIARVHALAVQHGFTLAPMNRKTGA